MKKLFFSQVSPLFQKLDADFIAGLRKKYVGQQQPVEASPKKGTAKAAPADSPLKPESNGVPGSVRCPHSK